MDKLLTMSTKELSRLEVMQRLKEKRLIQKEAAQMLGLSIRQIKRLWQKYQKQDAKGLISKRRGQASNNRLDAGVRQQALDLIKKKYSDFGPTLAHEKLVEIHKVKLSRESLRKLMIEECSWKPRRARYGKPVAFYGDKHDVFRINHPQPIGAGSGMTQFG
jgi:transposase